MVIGVFVLYNDLVGCYSIHEMYIKNVYACYWLCRVYLCSILDILYFWISINYKCVFWGIL